MEHFRWQGHVAPEARRMPRARGDQRFPVAGSSGSLVAFIGDYPRAARHPRPRVVTLSLKSLARAGMEWSEAIGILQDMSRGCRDDDHLEPRILKFYACAVRYRIVRTTPSRNRGHPLCLSEDARQGGPHPARGPAAVSPGGGRPCPRAVPRDASGRPRCRAGRRPRTRDPETPSPPPPPGHG